MLTVKMWSAPRAQRLLSRQGGKLFKYRCDRFSQWISQDLEQAPVRFCLRLIIDCQALLGSVQGQPDLLSTIAFAHREGFFEKEDLTIVGDTAEGMHKPRTDGQSLWDAGHQILGQSGETRSRPQSGWGIVLARSDIVRVLPAQESVQRGWDAPAVGEGMLVPELRSPEVVEGLDLPVVVGFGYGGEEHCNAQV
jgi:hypothetical protein